MRRRPPAKATSETLLWIGALVALAACEWCVMRGPVERSIRAAERARVELEARGIRP